MGHRNKGGWWTLTLFAANEIPSAVVTFVALIMFLQTDKGVAMSTLFASVMLLPWVAQPLMRRTMPGTGGGRLWLHAAEVSLTLTLTVFALTLGKWKTWMPAMLLWISWLSAWHDMLARRYYERRTGGNATEYQDTLRTLASQMATVLTYGLMIMVVGVFQIYFRQRAITYSWALGCYMLAGVYMCLTIINAMLLTSPGNRLMPYRRRQPLMRAGQVRQMAVLMLMLMPQGLMFYSRTIFLLASPRQGGLGCTLQEVGFAQGTIGVIAFLLGVTAGRAVQRRLGEERMKWPLTVCLGLSPAVYMAMTWLRPEGAVMLSVYTFLAQALFGLGLNSCRVYIEKISGERYGNTVNPLYIPVISLSILLPMAVSGFLLEKMTYGGFFMLDTLCAPAAWLVMAVMQHYRTGTSDTNNVCGTEAAESL